MPARRKIAGRSQLARLAHFKSGAGTHGGTQRQQTRRQRQRDRQEERAAEKASRTSGEGDNSAE